jgi:outer membrane protein assembly factor BamE (lipoprotein component of BamABCDE complex)
MINAFCFALIFTSLSLCTGCISFGITHEGNPIDKEAVAKIIKGRTTRAEVLELLGAPSEVEEANITNLAEQAVARYQGEKLTLHIDPALFNDVYIYKKTTKSYFVIFLILCNYYSSKDTVARLAVFFDRNGKVEGVGWTPEPK